MMVDPSRKHRAKYRFALFWGVYWLVSVVVTVIIARFLSGLGHYNKHSFMTDILLQMALMAVVCGALFLKFRSEIGSSTPAPPTVRERLDALAQTMERASRDLRNVAKRVEAETAEITASLDEQLAQAEAEVRARQAKLDELVAKSKQYEQTAAMNEEQAQAVAQFFRLQVEEVTDRVEQTTRRREWGLATIGGFTVGILTILAAHLFLGL